MRGKLLRAALSTAASAMLAAAAVVLPGPAPAAAASWSGDPPFTRLQPDIDVYPQLFALEQDRAGRIYVGNSEGVLGFDGRTWTVTRLPNGDVARALAYDTERSRLYVGGFETFGYIERTDTGVSLFRDLSRQFAGDLKGESFGDIWEIHLAPGGVFFRSLRHVFLYPVDGGAPRMWRHEGRFGGLTLHGGGVVMQFRGEGLRRLIDGEWQVMPGTSGLSELIVIMLPMPGGALLTGGIDGRWMVSRDGTTESFAMPAGVPSANEVSEAIALPNGSFVLATSDGYMYLVDVTANTARSFRLDSGYLMDVLPSQEGGLLVAGIDSVFHLDWPSRWTRLGVERGITGSLHALGRWNDTWYGLTGSGVTRGEPDATGRLQFHSVDWTRAEAWDLLPIDAGEALLAESYSVMSIRGGVVTPVTDTAVYPRNLTRSEYDPAIVYVGTESGVSVLHREGRSWRMGLQMKELGDVLVSSVVEDGPRRLWLGTERDGVRRLQLSDDYARVTENVAVGAAEGLEFGGFPGATLERLPGVGLVASTQVGVFRWQDGRFEREDLGGLHTVRGADEQVSLAVGPDGTMWAYSYRNVYRRDADGWHDEEIAGLRRGAIDTVAFDDDGSALFADTHAILRHDARDDSLLAAAPRVMLSSIERRDTNGRNYLVAIDSMTPLQMEVGDWSLAFSFALPDFRSPEGVRFRWRLLGADAQFTDWSPTPTVTYTRLPPGEYGFELQGRDSHGRITTIGPFPIVVDPPLHMRPWSLSIAALLLFASLLAITLGVIRIRTGFLERDRAQLQRVVSERTNELEAANKRLETMAHLDGLTGIANRRRLDDYLAAAWASCLERGRPLSLLAIDLDRFKNYNDGNGHLAGDELLMGLAQVLEGCVRRTEDLVARYGGDEFFVVLPGTDAATARDVGETMRAAVENARLGTTVSVGVATRHPRIGRGAQQGLEDLIATADAALYRAKGAGRNRVESAPAEVAA